MVLPAPPPLELTRIECVWLLRNTRGIRQQMQLDKLALEERIRGGNKDCEGAHRALDADLLIADGVVLKLWRTCGA